MSKKLFLILFLPLVLLFSCVEGQITKISLPEPQVRENIKVKILEIRNVSTNTNIDLGYTLELIKTKAPTFDFSKYYEQWLTNEPSPQEESKTPSESNKTKPVDEINSKSQSLTTITPSVSLNLNLDHLIRNTLSRNLKSFITSLGKYNLTLEEIRILNLEKIEEEAVKQATNRSLQKFLFTNYTTNTIFATNYYYSTNDTNKVVVEVIEKETIVEETKISKDFLWNQIISNYPWLLNLTNGIFFLEAEPAEFSISVFYDIHNKVINKYLTNIAVSLYLIVSNNERSNHVVLKTNIDLIELLSSDRSLFNDVRPFFYNYRTGIFVGEVIPEEYDIYLDGVYMGRGKTYQEFVSEGIHRITLSKGTFTTNEYIFIEKGKVNIYRKNLLKDTKGVSLIYVDSLPSYAHLFVENEYIGTTPTNVSLPPGKHRVRLKKGNLEKFSIIEVSAPGTNTNVFHLQNLEDKTEYHTMTGLTLLLGLGTLSSIFLYFWADSQERYYDFLYQKEKKEEYNRMREYYYYFKNDMRTTAIVGTIGTFILWGVTLGIESDKFSIKLSIPF